MRLEIECSWDNQQKKAKMVLVFGYAPSQLFCMPEEDIEKLKYYAGEAPTAGPKVLSKIEEIVEAYPESLYATFVFLEVLRFFQMEEEYSEIFKKMKKKFPSEVFVKCLVAQQYLVKKEIPKFLKCFFETEVLKGAFPEREEFFVEEAIFFHRLWMEYYALEGNEEKRQKHEKFLALIFNNLQIAALSSQSS